MTRSRCRLFESPNQPRALSFALVYRQSIRVALSASASGKRIEQQIIIHLSTRATFDRSECVKCVAVVIVNAQQRAEHSADDFVRR
jgi:hypothetical protein